MENETNAIEDLFNKTTGYLETRAELLKLKTIDKTAEVVSSVVSRLAIGVVFIIVIVFLNIGIALWLGAIFGQAYLGFFAVTAFYLVVLLVLFLSRKKILQSPVKNSIINNFLN